MAQGLLAYAEAEPRRRCVSDSGRSYTRREFNDRVNRLAYLLRSDIGASKSIAILAGNSADFVAVLIAAGLTGMPQVPVSWHLAVDEVAYILRSSGSSAVITDTSYEGVARQAAAEAGVAKVLVLGADLDRRLAEADASEPSTTGVATPIFYTSGTTGRPKGTKMAELRSQVSVDGQIAQFRAMGFDEQDVHLIVGPLYHGGPLMQALIAVLTGGSLHVLERFDAEEVLSTIDANRVTVTTLVPTHCVRLLRLADAVRDRYDVSSLREVFHIGSMMPIEVKGQMIKWLGPILTDAYGGSEIGTITRITSPEWLERPGSVGRPMPWFTLQIIGGDNQELAPGEVGTIYVTALNDADIVYLDDPVKTAEAHRGPRQFTLHDVGWLDDDGYLYLADRRDDLIISGGVNIYPAEVESILIMHPAVEDVGVFAIPDPEWGHAVKAAVQLRPGYHPSPATEAELLEWARARMAHLKVPRSVDFRDQLPRSASGKLHRRALRNTYWEAAEGTT